MTVQANDATAAWDDDDGNGATETEIVPSAPTEATTELAWSTEDEHDDSPHESWRAALVAAGAVLLLCVVVATLIISWRHQNAVTTNRVAPQPVATKPAAAVPPTQSVPTPEPPHPRPLQYDTRGVPILPKDPTAEEQQQVLLADLDGVGIPHPGPALTVSEAQAVCYYLHNGHHTGPDLFTWLGRTHPNYVDGQAGGLAGASIGIYCPQYAYLLDSANRTATS